MLRLPPLTAREQELLRLLAEGRSTSDMSELLGISPKTVRNYLSNLYTKLAVVDRAQAALAARSALVSMIGPQRRTGRLHAGGVAGVDRFPDRLP
ncbi:helix-turn-helix transcriptional regulator [Arthrobacter alpinus]|nr:helix-turn-helix transcriptional regulator [Arthrobacter alpinus]